MKKTSNETEWIEDFNRYFNEYTNPNNRFEFEDHLLKILEDDRASELKTSEIKALSILVLTTNVNNDIGTVSTILNILSYAELTKPLYELDALFIEILIDKKLEYFEYAFRHFAFSSNRSRYFSCLKEAKSYLDKINKKIADPELEPSAFGLAALYAHADCSQHDRNSYILELDELYKDQQDAATLFFIINKLEKLDAVDDAGTPNSLEDNPPSASTQEL